MYYLYIALLAYTPCPRFNTVSKNSTIINRVGTNTSIGSEQSKMSDTIRDQVGPPGYDFEPTMTDEQYNARLQSAAVAGNQNEEAYLPTNEEDNRIGNTAWCECDFCHVMDTRNECRCCREIAALQEKVEDSCITLHGSFDSMCLNKDILYATWGLLQYTKGNRPRPAGDLEHRHYRFIAYKLFTMWGHGYLGKGNRTPVPSCAVSKIREKFPEADGTYTGFLYGDEVHAEAMPE